MLWRVTAEAPGHTAIWKACLDFPGKLAFLSVERHHHEPRASRAGDQVLKTRVAVQKSTCPTPQEPLISRENSSIHEFPRPPYFQRNFRKSVSGPRGGYHCARLGILYNFGAEVQLSLTQTSRQSGVLALPNHSDPSPYGAAPAAHARAHAHTAPASTGHPLRTCSTAHKNSRCSSLLTTAPNQKHTTKPQKSRSQLL